MNLTVELVINLIANILATAIIVGVHHLSIRSLHRESKRIIDELHRESVIKG